MADPTTRPQRLPRAADGPADRANNFAFIRLAAAVMVLFGHSFDLNHQYDPLYRVTGVIGTPTLAVDIFFVVSGYLITQSWLRKPELVSYAAARTLRIVPGLVIVVLLSAFVLGPIVTDQSFHSYFSGGDPYRYVWSNVLLFPAHKQLPGVFTMTPYTAAVNGSLWTLASEVICYAIVPLLALIGLRSHGRVTSLAWVGVGLVGQMVMHGTAPLPGNFEFAMFFTWMTFFAAGAAVYAFSLPGRGVFAGRPCAGLWLLFFLSILTPFANVILLVLVPYTVFTIAFADLGRIGTVVTRRDLSYGIYLYAFPIQQLVISSLGGRLGVPPLLAFAIALPVSAGCAMGSWHLVEEPCLRLKRHLRRSARGQLAAAA